jgi:hypothetical protein
LIGAHYLIFIYGYGMITFGILSLLLVAQGTITSIYYTDQFALSAYLTSFTLFVFGILHFKQVKKENHE